MADNYFDFDYTTVIILASVICTFILQLWLCFNVRRRLFRLLPLSLFIISTIAFSLSSAYINSWDGIGYLFFAFLSFGLVWVCLIAWGLWAITRKKN